MNLYKISQNANTGYDTYDSAIVAAESEEGARNIHPSIGWGTEDFEWDYDSWADPLHVEVELIGEAVEGIEIGVILASFNAV